MLDTLNARIELKRDAAGTMDVDSAVSHHLRDIQRERHLRNPQNTYRLHNHSQTLAGPGMSVQSIQVQKETVTDGASLDAKFPPNDAIYTPNKV